MLTEYTTPGASVEVRDDESIYSLLTERIKRTGEDTVIAERKTAPGQWTKVTTGEFHKNVNNEEQTLWVCCFVNYESKVFEYLKKGTQVYVCGDVYADVFQKDDGSHIPSVSLTVSRIELLGKAEKKESGDGTASGQPQ